MDEFNGWEDEPATLKGCCSGAGTVFVLLGAIAGTEEADAEVLLGWGAPTAGAGVWADGGETVEDEGGMFAAGGSCAGAVSWREWGGGLGSLVTGAGVCEDIGGGETLPVEEGGEDVAGNVEPVVEAAASDDGRTFVELGQSAASEDGLVSGCLSAGNSRVLPLSCFILLKACCRVPEGADRERPKLMEGAAGTQNKKKTLNTEKWPKLNDQAEALQLYKH